MDWKINHHQNLSSGSVPRLTDELNHVVVADRRQALAAAWRGKRPRVASALPSQATMRLGAPASRQLPPAPSQRSHFASGFLLHRSTAASSSPPPPSPLETPAHAWPLQHHRNSSTVSPAPRCFFLCPLTALGKPPQRMQARRSSAMSPVVVATPPQSSSRSVS